MRVPLLLPVHSIYFLFPLIGKILISIDLSCLFCFNISYILYLQTTMYPSYCLCKDKSRKCKKDKESAIQIKSKLPPYDLTCLESVQLKGLDSKYAIFTKDLFHFTIQLNHKLCSS